MRPRSFRDKIGKSGGASNDQDAWLITYADLITQLMCFFVLVLMVSEPKMEKLGEIRNMLGSGFLPTRIETPFAAMYDSTEAWITTQGLDVEASVEYTPRGIVVDVAGDYLFESNSATITDQARGQLASWVASMKALPWKRTTLVVAGYTDDAPIPADAAFKDAWQLSAARAAAVAALLAELGVPKDRIALNAFGDVRPVVPNRTEGGTVIEANQARNRRVVIRVEKE